MGFLQTFKRRFRPGRELSQVQTLTGNTATYTAFSGGAYDNDIYRGAVDAIARNAAKLKGAHIVTGADNQAKAGDKSLDRLLQIQPNPYMTAYDLLYKLCTHYYLNNNAFAFLDRDGRGIVRNVYPITCTQADFLTDASGRLFVQFRFRSGNTFILPYGDVIHLRRNFNSNDLMGDTNEALYPALELAHTENEGIINGIKSGATIRGILKYTQVLAPEKLKADKEAFIAEYLDVANNGGIVATDSKSEYVPIDSKPVTIDPEQTKATATKIYNYLGISEKIVNSTYSEDEWGAFYESVIEPFALLLSLEFTRKVFTERERAFGNEIRFGAGRLMYASNQTKIETVRELMPFGVLTVNQALEILNLPPVEDGDRRLQSLNNANTEIVDSYQQHKAAGTAPDTEKGATA